jgi:hypothetical protein
MMRKAIRILLLATASAGLATADITFSLDPPSGAISGSPGQTVGWGFTVANSLSDYAVITGAVFSPDPTTQFTDFISPQYIVVGPGTPTVTETFDLASQQGVGSYLIPSITPAGSFLPGSIELTYDLYTVNPNDPGFDPVADLEASGKTVDADASINVVATPEPVNVVLWATMFAIITLGSSRKPNRLAIRENPSPATRDRA